MEKKLPNVFANPIEKNIGNVQEIFYGKEKIMEDRGNSKDIITKINQIFSSGHFVYKSKVRITTPEGIFEKNLVGRTELSLLTLENEIIPISSILDIEKI